MLMALLAIGIVNSLLVPHTLIHNVPPSIIFLVLIFFTRKVISPCKTFQQLFLKLC